RRGSARPPVWKAPCCRTSSTACMNPTSGRKRSPGLRVRASASPDSAVRAHVRYVLSGPRAHLFRMLVRLRVAMGPSILVVEFLDQPIAGVSRADADQRVDLGFHPIVVFLRGRRAEI